MSSIPLNKLGPAARAHVERQRAAARASSPTAAQTMAISTRTKKGKRDSARDALLFCGICEKAGVPAPVLEFRFHPSRLWRLDIAWPAQKLALEIDGGTFIPGGGGHNRGVGIRRDHEKGNSAAVMGWRILHCFPEQLLKFETIELVRRALRAVVR